MTAADNRIVGVGTYLEFIKPPAYPGSFATHQILIMPEGTTASGADIPMTMFRRRLTTSAPRKTWRAGAAHVSMRRSMSSVSASTKDEIIDNALAMMTPLLSSIRTHGWVLYKQVIHIEVTAEDLEHARLGKTPYKALGRVWKVRKALGFPKEYLHSGGLEAPVSTPPL
jgi:hypothetical protein